jgi:hypothetical protein
MTVQLTPIYRPRVSFSPWAPARSIAISRRESALCSPGIYVWGWFSAQPLAPLRLSVPPMEIVYIGEAKGPLWKRMRQFQNSFMGSSAAHAGGGRCRKRFEDDLGDLWVCWFSLPLPDPGICQRDIHHWSRPFLHHVERTLIWQYVKRWGRKPFENRT